MRVMYIIGEPGAGKSTLMRAIFEGVPSVQVAARVPHIAYHRTGHASAAQLGKERENGFGGTDAMAMSIQPKVLAWLASEPYPLIVAEGDRLGNDKFFREVRDQGHKLDVVLLGVPPEYAAERRARRGSTQDDTWLKGRQTKVTNLAQEWATVRLDGTLPPDRLAEQCRVSVPTLAPFFG